MALAAIQALYDDDDDVEDIKVQRRVANKDEEIEDRMAVINDPAFSVMSKIKLNLTPAIIAQVRIINLSINIQVENFSL